MIKQITNSTCIPKRYFTTRLNKYNTKNDGEITLSKEKVCKFSIEMDRKGFPIDTCQEYDAAKLNKYIKALNKIMTKDIKYEPELNSTHRYQMYNSGDMVQLWDNTEDKQVFNIGGRSIYA